MDMQSKQCFCLFVFLFSAGGWILDNFPHTKEQFTLIFDRGIIPDDVIVFREESNTNEILVERWHEKNAQGEHLEMPDFTVGRMPLWLWELVQIREITSRKCSI